MLRPVTAAILSAVTLLARSPDFEVASVKVNRSGDPNAHGEKSLAAGRFYFLNHRMTELIMWAYDVPTDYITGGPPWLASDRFDVIAKAPPNTTLRDARLMLRSLLAERSNLAVRQSEKAMSVFALTVRKQGPALTPAAGSAEGHCAISREVEGEIHIDCTSMTVADLADYLPDLAPLYIDRPVVDLTGIKGLYDFKLSWIPQPPGADVAAGPTIFDDLEKHFGLKLEKRKQAMPILIIDHIEREPTGN